jgi:phospholipase C
LAGGNIVRDPVTGFTRRAVLRVGGGAAALAALAPYRPLVARAANAGLRTPDSRPDPTRPAGSATVALPFDHIVIVMQENHSFDSYLGMLPLRGQPLADGLSFDAAGNPVNANPLKGGYIVIQRAPSLCTPNGRGSQSWNDTHRQIDGGKMDGFAATGEGSMVYWDEPDLPFYYSLAKTFCLANRWFASAPCQTYPNRRFMLAGTAFGLISTDLGSIGQDPPNGTIFDRLNAHGISWTNYFSDVPVTGIIESIPRNNPTHLASIAQFYLDCALGRLPAVSFVDSEIGIAPEVTGRLPAPFSATAAPLSAQNQDEENGDLSLGENFVSSVVNAVLGSPLWPRVLVLWVYDEHGGTYDHVPPPAAIKPDNIPPRLGSGDPPGDYGIYGLRVPAVVVSGYARPNAVTDVVHDHTSILATIEAKWNLPAMTYRDANAATMADFLDQRVRFPEPPALAAPSNLLASELSCSQTPLRFTVHPYPPRPSPTASVVAAQQLVVRFYGRRHRLHGALVELYTRGGTLAGLTVELRRGKRLVARASVAHVGAARHKLVLKPLDGAGRHTLLVRRGAVTLVRRRVTIG